MTGVESIAAAYEASFAIIFRRNPHAEHPHSFSSQHLQRNLKASCDRTPFLIILLIRVPGTITVHGAPIQILDLPGIIEGAKDGRGRGRQVIAGPSG